MKPVDLLASERVRRRLQVLMPHFQQLEPNERQKAFVVAAWDYVRNDDIDEALKLIDLLTPEYVRDVMPLQMKSDPAFDFQAGLVAEAIVDAGVHSPEYRVTGESYLARGGEA